MSIWPIEGATGHALSQQLRQVHDLGGNLPTEHGRATEKPDVSAHLKLDMGRVVREYVSWINTSTLRLRPYLAKADIERLIRTPEFFAIQAGSPVSAVAEDSARYEMMFRRTDLAAAADEIDRLLIMWGSGGNGWAEVVILDTNMYLHHPQEVEDMDWATLTGHAADGGGVTHIVIPLVVVDELDKVKDARAKAYVKARSRLKKLWTAYQTTTRQDRWVQPQAGADRCTVTLGVLMEEPGHRRADRADDEIVQVAASIGRLCGGAHFFTYDTAAAVRAHEAGLMTRRFEH